MKNAIKIIRLLGKDSRVLYVTILVGIISSANSIFVISYFGVLADRFIKVINGEASNSTVYSSLGIILAAYIFNAFLGYIQERGSDKFRLIAHRKIRELGFEHIERLPMQYFEKTRPGAILQRASSSVGSFINWLCSFAEGGIYNIFIPLFSLVPLFRIHIVIGAFSAVGLIICFVVQVTMVNKRIPSVRASNVEWENFMGVYSEIISHITTARAAFPLSVIRKHFDRAIDKHFVNRWETVRIENRFNFLQLLTEGLTIFAVLALTVHYGLSGVLTVAGFVSILGLIRASVGGTRGLGGIYSGYSQSVIESERFMTFIEEPIDDIDYFDAKTLNEIKDIEFKDVSYSYPDGKKGALRNIDLKIENGQTIAFVGRSGSGKSTISKLVLRFFNPDEGQLLINGLPASSFTQESIRAQIGSVMQDVVLFHTTVKENLTFVKPKVTEEDLWSAIKSANADKFVKELPEKLETVIGEKGVKLSGGQRQRMAIARAIIKNPSFVLLDEATSALDSESEKYVQDGLKKLLKGRTAIIIAHRLSTIAHADKIVVLDKGKIVEQGTFEELKKSGGAFSNLLAHQQL